jgi:hypothetical protein
MNPYFAILLICFITIFVIVAYGTFRCQRTSFVDPLTKCPVGPPWDKFLDGWAITHYLFFLLLGYLYPEHILFSWTLGVGWELVEFMAKDRPFYLSKCNYEVTTENGGGWWYGRWQDVVTNTLGLMSGLVLRKCI